MADKRLAGGDSLEIVQDPDSPLRLIANPVVAPEDAPETVGLTRAFFDRGRLARLHGVTGAGDDLDFEKLQEAIDACAYEGGGIVWMPPGLILLGGEVTVPAGVGLQGAGLGRTILRSIDAAGRVSYPRNDGADVGNRGPLSGYFTIDGDDVGTDLFKLDITVERHFQDIDATYSAGDGLVLLGSQNCSFNNVNGQHVTGTCVVFDRTAGNNLFFRCEFNDPLEYWVKFIQSAPGDPITFEAPITNKLMKCVLERGGYQGKGLPPDMDAMSGGVYHGAGRGNILEGCDMGMGGLSSGSAVKAIVEMVKDGTATSAGFTVRDCQLSGTLNKADVFKVGAGCHLNVEGGTLGENIRYVFAVDDTGRVTGNRALSGAITSSNFFTNINGGSLTRERLISNAEFGSRVLFGLDANQPLIQSYDQTSDTTYAKIEWRTGLFACGLGSTPVDMTFGQRVGDRFGMKAIRRGRLDGLTGFVDWTGPTDTIYADGVPTQAAANGSKYCDTLTGIWYMRRFDTWWETSRQTRPKYATGRYYLPEGPASGTFGGTTAPGANTLTLVAGELHRSATIDKLAARILTTTGTVNAQLYVYAADATSGAPTGAPLISSPAASIAAGGNIEPDVTDTLLQPGLYWWGLLSDNATTTFAAVTTGQLGFLQARGAATLAAATTPKLGYTVAATYGSPPTLTGSGVSAPDNLVESTAANIPLIWFKAA